MSMRMLKYEVWKMDEKPYPWHIMSCAPGHTPWILERGFATKEDAETYFINLSGQRPKTYRDKDPRMGDPELWWDREAHAAGEAQEARSEMGSEINFEAAARGEMEKNQPIGCP